MTCEPAKKKERIVNILSTVLLYKLYTKRVPQRTSYFFSTCWKYHTIPPRIFNILTHHCEGLHGEKEMASQISNSSTYMTNEKYEWKNTKWNYIERRKIKPQYYLIFA